LPGASKGESQELCFVPTGRYHAFVERRAGNRARPGPIVDRQGRVVGAHGGVHRFTIGQRKGLGVALGTPAFVVGIDAETSAVQLGGEDDLLHVGATLTGTSFFDDVAWPIRAAVRVRYRHQGVAATLTRDKAAIRVMFEEPV